MPTDPYFDRKHKQAKPVHKDTRENEFRATQEDGRGFFPCAQRRQAGTMPAWKSTPKTRTRTRAAMQQIANRAWGARLQRKSLRRMSRKEPLKMHIVRGMPRRFTPQRRKRNSSSSASSKNSAENCRPLAQNWSRWKKRPVDTIGAGTGAQISDLGFAQKKPYDSARAKGTSAGSKKQPATAKTVFARVRKALRSAVRFAARGIYFGVRGIYQFLMKLPHRTLLIGSGAFGLVLVTVAILAIALPGKPTKAEQGEQLAAFTALETEQTALEKRGRSMERKPEMSLPTARYPRMKKAQRMSRPTRRWKRHRRRRRLPANSNRATTAR